MNYGCTPRGPIDLAADPNLVRKRSKVEDFIEHLKKNHTTAHESLRKTTEAYKTEANRRHQG